MPFYPLLTLLILILVETANHVYIKFFRFFPFLKSFSFIGIAIHEYLHAAACVMTGAKIVEIKIHPTKGHVKHHPSALGAPGNILISMAPLIGGSILIYLLTSFITGLSPLKLHEYLTAILTSPNLSDATTEITLIFQGIKETLLQNPVKIPIIIFLLVNLAATITPSGRDYLNVVFGLAGLLIISTFSYLVPYEPFRNALDFIFFQISIVLLFTLLTQVILILFLALLVAIAKRIHPNTSHVQFHVKKHRRKR